MEEAPVVVMEAALVGEGFRLQGKELPRLWI